MQPLQREDPHLVTPKRQQPKYNQKIPSQVTALERMLSKLGCDAKTKGIQHLGNGPKDQRTVARVKSFFEAYLMRMEEKR